MMTLEQIADLLDNAPRYGYSPDSDQQARARLRPSVVNDAGHNRSTDKYLKISDRMARDISAALRGIARGESPRGVALERR